MLVPRAQSPLPGVGHRTSLEDQCSAPAVTSYGPVQGLRGSVPACSPWIPLGCPSDGHVAGTRGECSVPGILLARCATFRPGTDAIEGRADKRHPAGDLHRDGGDAVHAGSIDRLHAGPEQADTEHDLPGVGGG